MKKLFLLLSLALVSCSCENKTEPESGQKPAEYGTRIPLQSSITHVQPMTGIVLWNTSGSVKKEYVQLEFSYMLYNDVCKEKDVFDWTPMDKLLEAAAARGHQVVVRFRYTYPLRLSHFPETEKEPASDAGRLQGDRGCRAGKRHRAALPPGGPDESGHFRVRDPDDQ